MILLLFINLWPISTLCMDGMVRAVAVIICAGVVCGRYCLFPFIRAPFYVSLICIDMCSVIWLDHSAIADSRISCQIFVCQKNSR